MTQPGAANSGDARVGLQPLAQRQARIEKAKDPRSTLRRLWGFFAPFHARLAWVAACVVVYTLLGLCGPYLMGQAIDRFISHKDVSGLARTAILMLVAYTLSNGFQLLGNWLMANLSQRAL